MLTLRRAQGDMKARARRIDDVFARLGFTSPARRTAFGRQRYRRYDRNAAQSTAGVDDGVFFSGRGVAEGVEGREEAGCGSVDAFGFDDVVGEADADQLVDVDAFAAD